jgi:hypothetical protein
MYVYFNMPKSIFPCSPASDYTHRHVLVVDGGWVLVRVKGWD